VETLFLNKEGRWYHQGVEITHERTCALFYRNLKKGSDGYYYVKIGVESAKVIIEDVPYVIRSLDILRGPDGDVIDYRLLLNDDSCEFLDPETLFVGERDALYCTVGRGEHLARFSSPAYQLLCTMVEYREEDDRYWIPWRTRHMYIARKGADRMSRRAD
jgi:hypothetical protein